MRMSKSKIMSEMQKHYFSACLYMEILKCSILHFSRIDHIEKAFNRLDLQQLYSEYIPRRRCKKSFIFSIEK